MRRFASFGVAAVSAIALATPALTAPATAAPAASATSVTSVATASPVVAAKAMAKGKKFKIKKSRPGVQPGIAKLELSVKGLSGKGKVKFKIAGTNGVALKGKAKVKKGKAKYLVPALGTAFYTVKASYKGRKGKTKFEVYDSAMNITTAVKCDISDVKAFNYDTSTNVSGSVKFKGAPATTGYVDVYKDGNAAGGSSSPYLLGSASIRTGGTFDFLDGFCRRVVSGGTGSALKAGLPAGTYTFQAYYTADYGYDDYFSSNLITVTVVA